MHILLRLTKLYSSMMKKNQPDAEEDLLLKVHLVESFRILAVQDPENAHQKSVIVKAIYQK